MWWKFQDLPKANVFHPTYYSLTGGLEFSDFTCPVVITVHDFIQASHPHLEDEAEATVRHQNNSIPRAAHAICISKATERDLLERYPQMAGKTTVIYHGSSFPVSTETPPEKIFETPTFLIAGRRGDYNNFSF